MDISYSQCVSVMPLCDWMLYWKKLRDSPFGNIFRKKSAAVLDTVLMVFQASVFIFEDERLCVYLLSQCFTNWCSWKKTEVNKMKVKQLDVCKLFCWSTRDGECNSFLKGVKSTQDCSITCVTGKSNQDIGIDVEYVCAVRW